MLNSATGGELKIDMTSSDLENLLKRHHFSGFYTSPGNDTKFLNCARNPGLFI